MGKGFKDVKTGGDAGQKWEDDLPFELRDIRQLAKDDYKPIRLVGFVTPFMRVWVPTEASKAYDPYKTKVKQYPSVCMDFDPVTEEFTANECPYRKAHFKYTDPDTGEEKWGRLKPSKNYLIFFIDRERQEEREGISIKKKLADPKKFSDISCATVPTAFARAVQNVIDLHAKKTKSNPTDPTDSAAGYNLFFKFDENAKAEAKYSVMLGDDAPLTEEELKQVALIPSTINIFPKDSLEKIQASLARAGYILVERDEDPDAVLAARKEQKAAKSTVRAGVELVEDDEDETPAPVKKKAAPVVEDSFEDEDNDLNLDKEESEDEETEASDEEEVEEEEEAPVKAPAKKPASKPAPKPAADDEFDDDDF